MSCRPRGRAFPFRLNIQLFDGHGLKCVRLRQRYPDAGLACDFRRFNSITSSHELVSAFDNACFGSARTERAGEGSGAGTTSKALSTDHLSLNTGTLFPPVSTLGCKRFAIDFMDGSNAMTFILPFAR
jgi:hypothetical protein